MKHVKERSAFQEWQLDLDMADSVLCVRDRRKARLARSQNKGGGDETENRGSFSSRRRGPATFIEMV